MNSNFKTDQIELNQRGFWHKTSVKIQKRHLFYQLTDFIGIKMDN